MALAGLAGARRELLSKAPGDLVRHTTMGAVLLSTAAVAGVSAFFALYSVLALPWQLCLPAALAWALVVLNLDRMLIVSMTAIRDIGRQMLAAGLRLALAVVIGAVISTPLVLQIFQSEVEAELTFMKAEAIEQSKQALEQTYRRIDELAAERQRLLDVQAGTTGAQVSEDPDVKAAKAAFEAAERTYLELDRVAQCELDGTCGTLVPGSGDSYRQKRAAADDARVARDAAKRTLDETTARVTQRLANASVTEAQAARERLAVVERDLETEEERRRVAEGEATDAHNANTGLLARLEALDRVTDRSGSAAMAHVMLFLLFVCIEALPVAAKLFSSLGSPPLYDRLAEQQDEDIERAARLASATEARIVQAAEDARLTVAQDQAAAQVQAARQATQVLVDKQTRIAMRAIQVWGELATLRADEELDRWYRQHIGRHRPCGPGVNVAGGAFGPNGHPAGNGSPAHQPSAAELTVPIPYVPGP